MYFNINIIIFVLVISVIKNIIGSDYYKMQDGFMVENSLQPSENDIQLEDFFWTGSGDGPRYIKKPITIDENSNIAGDTYIKTATILATVYVDGTNDLNTDPLCTYDCNNIDNIELERYSPSDRRFWLLTIIAGFFGPEDFPLLEEKLAKLYRIAFMRQQARHLGITQQLRKSNNTNQNETQQLPENQNFYRRKKRKSIYWRAKEKFITKRDTENVIKSNLTLPEAVFSRNFTKEKEKFLLNRNNRNRVDILIHNVTYLTDADLRRIENEIDLNVTRNATSPSNLTELIYTVFVSGKPVLAKTAAEDMTFVTEEEAVRVMEKMIYTKSEPYLKEPHATPLIPALMNRHSSFLNFISDNPTLFVLSCLILFLLVIILIGILLITTTKRKKTKTKRAQSSRDALMETSPTSEDGGIIRAEEVDDGVSNLVFEKVDDLFKIKHAMKSPVMHFPLPPGTRPTSSSSSTSDSSLYYNNNRLIAGGKKSEVYHQGARDDNLYAMIMNSKKEEKREKRNKNRRKYITENRVGSIDDSKLPQSNSDSDPFEINSAIQGVHYDHNEAFNPNVQMTSHYNKNKVMTDEQFGTKTSKRVDKKHRDTDIMGITEGVEAINKELFKALNLTARHPDRSSLDSGSIGSYLSMASVKSFPRCSVPEPLSRVLEPLSVTHLDHYDADLDTSKSLKFNDIDQTQFQRSSSDGADPGVVGPVVWEMHKQEMEKKNVTVTSPIRDPISTRNRFEGLLEGAIKMYEESHDGTDSNTGTPRYRDFRGKSAPKLKNAGNLSRNGSGTTRPLTAGNFIINSTNSTQPPTPTNKRAWSSGAPSPLVRPMSAGPFHRPIPPSIDVTRVLAPLDDTIDRTTLSTAPLIQAIQEELKKFNKS